MVGPGGGTWLPYRTGLREDPRFAAAFSLLVEPLVLVLRRTVSDGTTAHTLARVLADRIVLGAFLDLSIAALTDGYDDGCVDRVSDGALAMKAVPWLVESGLASPVEIGVMLREAFLEAGVLVQDHGHQRIADFDTDNRRLLKDRERHRKETKGSTEPPQSVHGDSTEHPALQEQEQEQEPEEEEESNINTQEDIADAMSPSDESGDPLYQALLETTGRSGNEELVVEILEQIRDTDVEDETFLDRLGRLGPDVRGEPPYRLRDLLLRSEEHRSGRFDLPRRERSSRGEEGA